MVGTAPLVPLEPFESLELSRDCSVFELVFLRRNSLKKGIVACKCLVYYPESMGVSNCLQITRVFMETIVQWNC